MGWILGRRLWLVPVIARRLLPRCGKRRPGWLLRLLFFGRCLRSELGKRSLTLGGGGLPPDSDVQAGTVLFIREIVLRATIDITVFTVNEISGGLHFRELQRNVSWDVSSLPAVKKDTVCRVPIELIPLQANNDRLKFGLLFRGTAERSLTGYAGVAVKRRTDELEIPKLSPRVRMLFVDIHSYPHKNICKFL